MDNNDEDSKFSEEIENVIVQACKENDLTKYKIFRNKIETSNGNFVGSVFNIKVEGYKNDKPTKLHLFLKVAPICRSEIDVHRLYHKECFLYNVISKKYTKFQEDYKVPDAERYTFAKCYGCSDVDNDEWIILENMKYKNYTIWQRKEPLTLEYVNENIKTLARFHSLSFVLEKAEPEFFDEFVKPLIPYGEEYGEKFEIIDKPFIQMGLNTLDKYKNLLANYYKSSEYKSLPLNCYRPREISVLCHGDFRTENILIKHDDNGKISSIIPIDYQIMSYLSPLIDFFYFTFGATHTNLRRKHFEEWVDLYYTTMEKYLRYFDIDIETVFPRKYFDEELKNLLPYALFVATRMLPFFTVVCDEEITIKDLFDENSNAISLLDNKLFRERFSGIIEDLVARGVFKNFQCS